jgi:hypothetical protein
MAFQADQGHQTPPGFVVGLLASGGNKTLQAGEP